MSGQGPRHLDRELWRAVLEGRPEAAGVRAHLREPCDTCDEFLASLEGDPLDGVADDALHATPGTALDELRFERVLRAIDGPKKRMRLVQAGGALLAVAAAALLFVTISAEPESRLKGEAPEPERPVRLDALKVGADGALSPLGARGQVAPGDRVVFRVHLAHRGCVGLWSRRGAVTERLLSAPICFSMGDQVIAPEGQVVGLVVEPGPNLTVMVAPLAKGQGHPEAPEGSPSDQVELQITPEAR